MHPTTPIYLFPSQGFPNCKVFMNHLEILSNYKTQPNRPYVGPRVCISDQLPGAAVAQGAVLLDKVLIHGEASTALSSLTSIPPGQAHTPQKQPGVEEERRSLK